MAFTKYIIPVLALTGAALAQSDSCPDTSNGVFTINNQGDAGRFQNCQKFQGSILISSTAAGNLQITGVEQISGDLTSNNASNVQSIYTDQLNTIGGRFALTGLTGLSNLQMDSLTTVNTIDFEALPVLQELSFKQGVTTASGVRIVNTGLTSLSGIELMEVSALDITNNNDLTDLNVNNLAHIDLYANFVSNGNGLNIKFPNLLVAANLTFGNISSVGLDSLAAVNGSLGCYSNNLQSFSAPNLTTVGNELVFDDNTALSNISAPSLVKVGGGFNIDSNPKLASIDGFPNLKTVGGAIDFHGAFDNITLPGLAQQQANVQGALNVTSTGNLTCASLNSFINHVKGHKSCNSTGDNKSGSSSSSGSSGSGSGSSGSGSSSSHKNSASSAQINIAATGLLGSLAFWLLI